MLIAIAERNVCWARKEITNLIIYRGESYNFGGQFHAEQKVPSPNEIFQVLLWKSGSCEEVRIVKTKWLIWD